MPTRLPVGKVVLGAFLIPWWKRREFARALASPLGALAALTLPWYYYARDLPLLANGALYLLYTALFVLFAVRCHRLVLLDAAPRSVEFMPPWTWRETRFAAWLVAAWIIGVAAGWTAIMVIGIVVLNVWKDIAGEWLVWAKHLLSLVALYYFARLCPLLPATAVDRRPTLRWAWQLTEANGWRLMVVVGVLPWVLSHLLGLLYRQQATVVETVLLTIVGIALMPIEIAAISISYRELAGDGDPKAAAP